MSSTSQVTGLASGLDTTSIINSLMAIERQPRDRLALRQTAEQARHDALGDIASKLRLLKLSASALRSAGTWTDTQSATSGDESKFTARRTGGAGPGGYDVQVGRLASSTQRTYGYTPPAADATLSFTVKDATGADVTTGVTLAAGTSLDDAVAKINTTNGSPVYAVNVQGSLVLSSRTTGEVSRFTLGDDSGLLAQTSERLGQKAQVTVDGTLVESDTNKVTGAIPGVELTLKATTATAVQVNVSPPGPDRDGLTTKIQAFVDAYNTVVDTVRSKLSEKPVANATTASDAALGSLYGDLGLNSVLNGLRQSISNPMAGAGAALNGFAALGVSTGAASGTINQDAVAGKLTFDASKLTAALDTDPLAVRRLLGGVSGTNGLGQRLESLIDPIAGTGGSLANRISSSDSSLNQMKNQLADFDDRLTTKQEALQKQYAALETALNAAQSRASDIAGLSNSSSD